MDDVRKRRRGAHVPGVLQEQDHPLDADREAARGRGLAAELLEEAVVAPAARDGALRAEPVADPLEHGAIVVVETADEPGIDLECDAGVGEQRLQAGEVRARPLAQAIDELRRAGNQRLQRGILAVEDPERVRVQAAPRIRVEIGLVLREVGDERAAMLEPLARVADRVQMSARPSRSSAFHSRASMTICSASTSGPAKPSASASY